MTYSKFTNKYIFSISLSDNAKFITQDTYDYTTQVVSIEELFEKLSKDDRDMILHSLSINFYIPLIKNILPTLFRSEIVSILEMIETIDYEFKVKLHSDKTANLKTFISRCLFMYDAELEDSDYKKKEKRKQTLLYVLWATKK